MFNKMEIQKRVDDLKKQNNIIKRFYHLHSIQNFIHYFDNLDKESKEIVYPSLIEYLNVVVEEPIMDIRESEDLFNHYIRPIGNIYEKSFDFMPMMSTWVLIFWGVVLSVFIYLFSLPIIFYWIIWLLLLAYKGYILKKQLQKKLWGFKW